MFEALLRIKEKDIQIGTIIDIGASNGKFSLMAMKAFPNSNVLAFWSRWRSIRMRWKRFQRGITVFNSIWSG